MAEVEKILNEHSITHVSSDHRDPEPLTPNKLLLLRPNSCLPQGVFHKNDILRQVQYLADVFWRRWTKEYLPALQVRQKSQVPQRNVKVDDLVLTVDENLPCGQWPLGIVLHMKLGRDFLVRSCRVKCGSSIKVRPVTKLCLLESAM